MSKRNFVIFLVVAFVVVISTYAYASSNEMIEINTYVNTFTSPDNWKPWDTVKNEIIIKNPTNRLLAVRVSLNQKWVSKKGNVLDVKQDDNDTVLFNYDKNNFVLVGNYYYYKKALNPKDKVLFLRSVTLNPKITNDFVCSTKEKDGKKIQKCESSGEGYDGATYTLVTNIETIDYEVYKEEWNTNIEIYK